MKLNKKSKIYVAGHRGMVGAAVVDELRERGYSNITVQTSKKLDLRNQKAVDDFIQTEKPDAVIIAAARVGGILANDTYPYRFLYDNLMIEANLINAAHRNDVASLVFLGSSCIYPKFAPQPMKEEHLLTGELEPTNQWYAIAKIGYLSLMPTNLYGHRDNFDLETSHVLPAMIRKFHEALPGKPVTLWGTGSPRREFLHVSDAAKAVVFGLENDLKDTLYNVGTGTDIPIKDLALLVQKITGHTGEIRWDTSKPDGTPRKLLDVSKMHEEGWRHSIELEDGIRETYEWFKHNIGSIKELHIES